MTSTYTTERLAVVRGRARRKLRDHSEARAAILALAPGRSVYLAGYTTRVVHYLRPYIPFRITSRGTFHGALVIREGPNADLL